MSDMIRYAGQDIPIERSRVSALRTAIAEGKPTLFPVDSDLKTQIAIGPGIPLVVVQG